MRQVTRKGLITVAAAGGVFVAVGGGWAHADSGANGTAANSPGVASGNTVQVPVHAPVNVCGNTVNVVGLLNPAMGNKCANVSKPGGPGASGGSSAEGHTGNSPGVASGNNVQAPVDVPVNVCGNTVDVIGILNPAAGNACANVEPPRPGKPENPGHPEHPGKPENPGHPEKPVTPPAPAHENGPNTPGAHTVTPPRAVEELAETGSAPLGVILPAGAGMLLAGSLLYRRARRAA
ncbi:chaplin family protein [Streptomyces sp. NPDC001744]|uniref:chaplin n=1 Tax=Streptomyces sp. NPDC001744 TaxID=3364606 RepID=UPI003676343E